MTWNLFKGVYAAKSGSLEALSVTKETLDRLENSQRISAFLNNAMFFLNQSEPPGNKRHHMESVTFARRHVKQTKESE